jgi:hypothetical protein
MTARKVSAFIDAIARGQRPKRQLVEADDVDVLRAAIELRAARPGDSAPSTLFTDGLFRQLSDQLGAEGAQPKTVVTPARPRRPLRLALIAASVAAALIAGTAVVTDVVSHSGTSRDATQLPKLSALRTGTFQTTDGQVLGQIVAYRGDPSWVFMNVNAPDYNGAITCMLQVEDGTTVAFGTFTMHNGTGQFSKNLGSVDVSALRGAKLVDPAGVPVAAATFAT